MLRRQSSSPRAPWPHPLCARLVAVWARRRRCWARATRRGEARVGCDAQERATGDGRRGARAKTTERRARAREGDYGIAGRGGRRGCWRGWGFVWRWVGGDAKRVRLTARHHISPGLAGGRLGVHPRASQAGRSCMGLPTHVAAACVSSMYTCVCVCACRTHTCMCVYIHVYMHAHTCEYTGNPASAHGQRSHRHTSRQAQQRPWDRPLSTQQAHPPSWLAGWHIHTCLDSLTHPPRTDAASLFLAIGRPSSAAHLSAASPFPSQCLCRADAPPPISVSPACVHGTARARASALPATSHRPKCLVPVKGLGPLHLPVQRGRR